MKLPPPLAPGDPITVVAPSSPFDATLFARGLAWLRERYEVSVREDLLDARGYLAGDDARRLAELDDALRSDRLRAVIAARGGYGATRITARADWSALARNPKWLVGFSDVTALHVEANKVGVASLHASMVAALGDDPMGHGEWIDALEGRFEHPWGGLRVMHQGGGREVRGPLFGGNLSVLEACASAGRLQVPSGCILLLEDCNERPYRVDRMLTSLRLGGYLQHAAAIVFGDFTGCRAGPDGVTVDEVLEERTRGLGVAVACGAPFGHGSLNRPWVVGGAAVVDGASLHWLP